MNERDSAPTSPRPETVAIYPKVTGFVKAIRVDRGSRVRAGDLIAELEAPELLAQRAEALSRLQAAEAQLAAAQSKAAADTGTYDPRGRMVRIDASYRF